MLTYHRHRQSDDEGFAVVIALLVTAIAYLIMTAVLAQAIHNLNLAGYGRRRLAAVNAAEAGLNWYANLLSTSSVVKEFDATRGWTMPASTCWNPSNTIPTTCWYVLSPSNPVAKPRVTVADRPETARFELRVLLLTKNPCTLMNGDPAQCGLTASNVAVRPTTWDSQGAITQEGILKAQDTVAAPWPDTAYMVVRSTGTVGTVQRTLESYVRLRAVRTAIPGGFVVGAACLDDAAKLVIRGDFSVVNQALAMSATVANAFDANTCHTTNLEVRSGDELHVLAEESAGGSLSIGGGGLDVDGNTPFSVAKNVEAAAAVKLGSGSMAPFCPTTGSSQCVDGDVNANGTVTVGPNAFVAGAINPSASPPVITFPDYPWDESKWRSPWGVQTRVGTSGLLAELGSWTTPTVFHVIGAGCDLDFAGASITLKTRIAIVSECRFKFKGSPATITKAASSPDGALLLISATPTGGANCGSPTKNAIGPQDIQIYNNPTIDVAFFMYTPCVLWLGNNQNQFSGEVFLKGQFTSRFLVVDQGVTLTQVDIGNLVPTLPGQLTGFKQDVRFVREISTTIASGNLPL